MIIKEIAKKTIDNLPNEAAYDDIIYALYIKSRFENGLKEILDGKGISQNEAEQRLQKWVR